MRAFPSNSVSQPAVPAGPSILPGLWYVAAAGGASFVYGWTAGATALLLTALVTFVLWLPVLTLIAGRGEPIPELNEAPALPRAAKLALFVLWTATAWVIARAVA